MKFNADGMRLTDCCGAFSTFHDDTLDTFNIIAEIPGTDRADEVVMLGAHFASWHAGTGAPAHAAGPRLGTTSPMR